MKHRVAGREFSRRGSHRMAMYRNLVGDLLQYERIVTTEPKAKEIRGLADKVITLSKAGNLHARRRALALVSDKKAVDKAFAELASRYASRSGGYTRVLKLGARPGDGASMAIIELVK